MESDAAIYHDFIMLCLNQFLNLIISSDLLIYRLKQTGVLWRWFLVTCIGHKSERHRLILSGTVQGWEYLPNQVRAFQNGGSIFCAKIPTYLANKITRFRNSSTIAIDCR